MDETDEKVSLKRKLNSDDGEQSAAYSPRKNASTYLKHEMHWLLDGNMLLQIGKTRFKIHRSRLASESRWFQALVELRAGNSPDIPTEYRNTIDEAIKSAQKVGECDLFFLDFEDGPNANKFAALLSAMQYGIEFVYENPSFSTVADIYEASQFFDVPRYSKFSEMYLKTMFDDSFESIPPNPSPYAARALILGDCYGLQDIKRRCFYDLARTHPIAIPTEDDASDCVPSASDIDDANSTILIDLLNIQRRLALSWDSIYLAIDEGKFCDIPSCTHRHCAADLVGLKAAKIQHPFDPITAMNVMLATASQKKSSCKVQKKRLEDFFDQQSNQIWEEMAEWAGISESEALE
ncbi:hypothetical protein JR316_0012819 [Psilocybe cubensis]|uniref:BTB domain-containing protein n=2 Tax=Psilocybe cubensis TaxID=181762 RepID=A0A8H7XR15_PSICU|nr:hypothetical protein JR316_0012819 [Psilocybe cubensis]KAH9474361.1 hypothetical protein JR316_0012819 [Psilocybe cubensis]